MRYVPKNFGRPEDDVQPRSKENAPYVLNDKIVIALDVALETARPLLVAGDPGSGKSRLAEAMAANLGWNYLANTVTSRTRLEELTGEMDQLERLRDAQAAGRKGAKDKEEWVYRKPGVLWWAFSRETAKHRGGDPASAGHYGATLNYPGSEGPNAGAHADTVLLLDEIDKAEPDLPNDLLEPLDRQSFSLSDGYRVKAPERQKRLLIITTNRERELPQAFIRRCVTLLLEFPEKDKLVQIGCEHFKEDLIDKNLVESIAKEILEHRKNPREGRIPGTSEFLDAVHACHRLDIDPQDNDKVWSYVKENVLSKPLHDKT